MTRLGDPAVEHLLDDFRTDEEADWEDVLVRSQKRTSRRRTRARRFSVGRRRIVVSLACLLGVAAAPAVAYVANDWFQSQPVRTTVTHVRVEIAGRRHAAFALRSSGLGLKRGRSGFEATGASEPRHFSWTLELSARFVGARAEIDLGARRIVLCEPCATRNGGLFVVDSLAAVGLLNGRASLHVGGTSKRIGVSAGGRLGVARGLGRARAARSRQREPGPVVEAGARWRAAARSAP